MNSVIIANQESIKKAEEKGLNNYQEKFSCKITVLKCEFNSELYIKYPYGMASKCGRLEEGQEFKTNSRWDPPVGFCIWAWRDLIPSIHSFHEGREIPSISCCTDGLRPVTFKLEKVDVVE